MLNDTHEDVIAEALHVIFPHSVLTCTHLHLKGVLDPNTKPPTCANQSAEGKQSIDCPKVGACTEE